jgi:succinyl-diaminopimelate desuccinylase
MAKNQLLTSARGGQVRPKHKRLLVERILGDLVAIPTVSPDVQANSRGLDYIEAFLAERGMHIIRHEHNGKSVLLATTRQTKSPKVMLTAHLDVVPALDHLFTMEEKDGKLFGRGVWDMKHAIAAFLSAVDLLGDTLLKHDFGILIYTDDEAEDEQLDWLLTQGYSTDIVVLPDGSDNWQIEAMAKGLLYVALRITGKTSHGSRPWEGDSASLKMIDLLHELRSDFHGHGPETDTLNIGLVHSGSDAWNQLPDHAEATLDIRIMSEERQAVWVKRFEALAAKYGAFLEIRRNTSPLIHDRAHQHMQRFAECIYEVTGIKDEGFISFGTTSAVYFLRRGIPCIITSPPGGGRHSEEEWIDKQGLLNFPEVIKRYIETAP